MRIIAVHPGALGDVILFGRLLARLAPADVTLITGAEKGALLVGAGAVRRALDFDSLPMHEVYGDAPPGGCHLAGIAAGYDRLISCFAAGDRKAELRLAALCGCDSAAFIPVRPPAGFAGHLLDLWLDLLDLRDDRGTGVAPAIHGQDAGGADATAIYEAGERRTMSLPRVRQWSLPEHWRSAGAELVARAGVRPRQPYWVIHPGSGGRAKCWAILKFIDLAGLLSAEFASARPVFVLGPVETECLPREQIDELAARFALIRCPPLEALAGAIAGCAGYVGNDSGVSHLAAAVGAPTVAIFGASHAANFAPLGPRVAIAAARSMSDITVHQVLECCKSLLKLQ